MQHVSSHARFRGRDPGFAPPNAVTLTDDRFFTVGP